MFVCMYESKDVCMSTGWLVIWLDGWLVECLTGVYICLTCYVRQAKCYCRVNVVAVFRIFVPQPVAS